MNRDEASAALAKALTEGDTKEAYTQLYTALKTAWFTDGILPELGEQMRSYSLIGYYYAFVKDRKRHLTGGAKLAYSFFEDQMEGLLKALDKGVIARMHESNLTGRHNV